MNETPVEVLKRNNLSVTNVRLDILSLLLKKNTGLSHSAIEKGIKSGADRTTIYRTLQVFVEKGILHTIPTPDDIIQYALSKNASSDGNHLDSHAHFSCTKCGKLYCLDSVEVPSVKLPRGFQTMQKDLVIHGICDACSKK